MNIEEIAKAAIAALQRASIEELEAKCKEFGHVPVRRQHHSWQSAVYFYDMSLMEEAATVVSSFAAIDMAKNDDVYWLNDIDDCSMAA